MSDSFDKLVKQLKNGQLPPELDFRNTQHPDIDWSKVQYNSFYKSPTFFESKFPNGWSENLPGFDKVLETIVDNAQSPLEEMLERQVNIKDHEEK